MCICCRAATQAANEKLARTTAFLEEEKARAEALLYRMSGLIACFPAGPNAAAGSGSTGGKKQQSMLQQMSMLESTINSQSQQMQGSSHASRHPTLQALSGTLPTTSDHKQSSALGEHWRD